MCGLAGLCAGSLPENLLGLPARHQAVLGVRLSSRTKLNFYLNIWKKGHFQVFEYSTGSRLCQQGDARQARDIYLPLLLKINNKCSPLLHLHPRFPKKNSAVLTSYDKMWWLEHSPERLKMYMRSWIMTQEGIQDAM